MSTPRPVRDVTIRAAGPDDGPALAQLTGLSASTRRGLDADIAAVARGDARAPVILVAEMAQASGPAAGPTPEAPGAVVTTQPPVSVPPAVGPAPAGSNLVGAAFGLLQHDDGHVVDLAVAAQWRRSGIGAALLRALLDALMARGARAVTLEVRAGNLGAQALYRAAGCTVEGRRPAYYPDGEDALLLWWRPETAPCAATAPGTMTETPTGTPTGTVTETPTGTIEEAATSASGTGGSRC